MRGVSLRQRSSPGGKCVPISPRARAPRIEVTAIVLLDLVLKPALVDQAWDYFKNVQTKTIKYEPLIRPGDRPAIELNAAILERQGEMAAFLASHGLER